MPIDNPKQVNKARYYLDDRSQVCKPCMHRLTGGDNNWQYILPEKDACTECAAFAAGTHASLPVHSARDTRRTPTEIRAKLIALQAAPAQDVDYVAGMLDGACSALGWVLGKTGDIEWGGK